jgi:threonine/homoserine/homoserine lactone efflux protein
MEIKIWLLFVLAELLIEITPGPAVLLVSSQELKYGTKCSCYGALGIVVDSDIDIVCNPCVEFRKIR